MLKPKLAKGPPLVSLGAFSTLLHDVIVIIGVVGIAVALPGYNVSVLPLQPPGSSEHDVSCWKLSVSKVCSPLPARRSLLAACWCFFLPFVAVPALAPWQQGIYWLVSF